MSTLNNRDILESVYNSSCQMISRYIGQYKSRRKLEQIYGIYSENKSLLKEKKLMNACFRDTILYSHEWFQFYNQIIENCNLILQP